MMNLIRRIKMRSVSNGSKIKFRSEMPMFFSKVEMTSKEKADAIRHHFKDNADIVDVSYHRSTKFRPACIEILYDEECKEIPAIPTELKVDLPVMMRSVNAFG